MSRNSWSYRIIALFMIIVMLLSFAACGAQKKPVKNTATIEEEEPPKELDKVKDSMEKIENSLEKIHEEAQKPFIVLQQEMMKKKQEESSQNESQGDSQQSGQQNQSQQSSEQTQQSSNKTEQKELTQEEVQKMLDQARYKSMEDIKKDVQELHNAWNDYEPKAVSSLGPQASISGFENSLNTLTKSVDSADVYNSLLAINELYRYLPDFYLLYKTKTPPELDKLRYGVKKIMLTSEVKDFATTNETLVFYESIWAVTKPKLKKDVLDDMNKLDFALNDLKLALEAQNDKIIKVKSEVILKLLDSIEKIMEKSK